MKVALGLFLALAILWALLSNMWTGLLIGLGVISCALVTWIAVRMRRVDGYHTAQLPGMFGLIRYLLWLTWEVVLANIAVARLIIAPRLKLNPAMVTVDASDLTELGQVIYANSITLTPGTVSLFIREGQIQVHSLVDSAADDLAQGHMHRRVKQLGAAVIAKTGDGQDYAS